MAKYGSFKVGLLLLLVFGLFYMITNKDSIIQEHLSNGPPTLLTLQSDTKELDKKMTAMQTEFDKMKEAGKQGADAAATARAQISATKFSGSTTSPP